MVENCLKAQYETGFNYFIYHDVIILESDVLNALYKEGIKILKESKTIAWKRKVKMLTAG